MLICPGAYPFLNNTRTTDAGLLSTAFKSTGQRKQPRYAESRILSSPCTNQCRSCRMPQSRSIVKELSALHQRIPSIIRRAATHCTSHPLCLYLRYPPSAHFCRLSNTSYSGATLTYRSCGAPRFLTTLNSNLSSNIVGKQDRRSDRLLLCIADRLYK
jgi:hypothetical protein